MHLNTLLKGKQEVGATPSLQHIMARLGKVQDFDTKLGKLDLYFDANNIEEERISVFYSASLVVKHGLIHDLSPPVKPSSRTMTLGQKSYFCLMTQPILR